MNHIYETLLLLKQLVEPRHGCASVEIFSPKGASKCVYLHRVPVSGDFYNGHKIVRVELNDVAENYPAGPCAQVFLEG